MERQIADADAGDQGNRSNESEPEAATHLSMIALSCQRLPALSQTLTGPRAQRGASLQRLRPIRLGPVMELGVST